MPSKNVYVGAADAADWAALEAMAAAAEISVSKMILRLVREAAGFDPHAQLKADINQLRERVTSLEVDVSALAKVAPPVAGRTVFRNPPTASDGAPW